MTAAEILEPKWSAKWDDIEGTKSRGCIGAFKRGYFNYLDGVGRCPYTGSGPRPASFRNYWYRGAGWAKQGNTIDDPRPPWLEYLPGCYEGPNTAGGKLPEYEQLASAKPEEDSDGK